MKPKYPAILFYCGDWLKDPKLSSCSPSTRGIWVDLLCAMHENDNSGEISGTCSQLSRMARCTDKEMASALVEIENTGTGLVAQHNGIITVICRRMKREFNNRKNNRIRQQRFQRKLSHNGTPSAIEDGICIIDRGTGGRNPGGNGEVEHLDLIRSGVAAFFKRDPMAPLSDLETRALCEVGHRPKAPIELLTIETYREDMAAAGLSRWLPQTFRSQLEKWGETLDKALTFEPNAHPAPGSCPPGARQAPVFIQIKALEDEISKHPANRESVFHDKNATELQRNDLRAKRQRLKELKGVG